MMEIHKCKSGKQLRLPITLWPCRAVGWYFNCLCVCLYVRTI